MKRRVIRYDLHAHPVTFVADAKLRRSKARPLCIIEQVRLRPPDGADLALVEIFRARQRQRHRLWRHQTRRQQISGLRQMPETGAYMG